MRDLVQRLNALCDGMPFQTSWFLKDLAPGARADRLGDVPVPSASTRKISIMMAALSAVHAGKLALDQKVTIEARYQDNDSGTFQHLTPGFWITFRDALVMMIIVSDNTCTGTVVDLVGLGEIQRYCESIGLTGTIHRFGIPPRLGPDHTLDQVTTTTPNDQGLLLELILRGTERPDSGGATSVHARAVPAGAGHPQLAEAEVAPAFAAAPRHQGRPQDRDGLARLHGCGHHLQERPSALHPDGVHGTRARRAAGRHAGVRGGRPAHRPHGAAVLRRARRPDRRGPRVPRAPRPSSGPPRGSPPTSSGPRRSRCARARPGETLRIAGHQDGRLRVGRRRCLDVFHEAVDLAVEPVDSGEARGVDQDREHVVDGSAPPLVSRAGASDRRRARRPAIRSPRRARSPCGRRRTGAPRAARCTSRCGSRVGWPAGSISDALGDWLALVARHADLAHRDSARGHVEEQGRLPVGAGQGDAHRIGREARVGSPERRDETSMVRHVDEVQRDETRPRSPARRRRRPGRCDARWPASWRRRRSGGSG